MKVCLDAAGMETVLIVPRLCVCDRSQIAFDSCVTVLRELEILSQLQLNGNRKRKSLTR